jgi:hypothetical protein
MTRDCTLEPLEAQYWSTQRLSWMSKYFYTLKSANTLDKGDKSSQSRCSTFYAPSAKLIRSFVVYFTCFQLCWTDKAWTKVFCCYSVAILLWNSWDEFLKTLFGIQRLSQRLDKVCSEIGFLENSSVDTTKYFSNVQVMLWLMNSLIASF